MSRIGDCWGLRTSLRGHNTIAESFFATIKKEYAYQTTFENREIAKLGIFDYIEAWYNRERMHSYLNYLSPCEFEQAYLDMITGIRKQGKTLGSYSASGF